MTIAIFFCFAGVISSQAALMWNKKPGLTRPPVRPGYEPPSVASVLGAGYDDNDVELPVPSTTAMPYVF